MKTCLEGVKILELSHYIAAPFCGQLLGDMGAEIIKIERPGEGKGDAGRENAPFHKGMSLYYGAYNRNKKTLTLDISKEQGKEIFRELVKKVDIVIQNFRPGVLEKLNLGYEDLKAINPRIIMTSISGYGQNGPYKTRSALDMAIQAVSGFMSITGEPDGAPMKAGPVVSDFVAGLYGAYGTLAAYNYREKTGLGQHVDIALLDCMFTLLENYPTAYYLTGETPPRAGNGRPWTAVCGTYKTKDGYVHISATQNALYRKLCMSMHREDLLNNPQYETPRLRKTNEKELNDIVTAWMSKMTSDQAVEILETNGVPNGKVNSVVEITEHEQIKAREMIVTMQDAILGKYPVVANPVKMSAAKAVYSQTPSLQGAYSKEILQSYLGLDLEQIKTLKINEVI